MHGRTNQYRRTEPVVKRDVMTMYIAPSSFAFSSSLPLPLPSPPPLLLLLCLLLLFSCVWRLEPWWTVYCRLRHFAANAVVGIQKLIAENRVSTAEADLSSAKGDQQRRD